MRKERRIGGPVRVSTGDRGVRAVLMERATAAGDGELDERGVVGVDIGGGPSFEFVPAGAADAALDEQLEVDATPFVIVEAVVERVPECVEAEVLRAAGVGTVQERAVVATVGHSYVGQGLIGQETYRRRGCSDVKEKGPINRASGVPKGQ